MHDAAWSGKHPRRDFVPADEAEINVESASSVAKLGL
jgi:hypothetical protein